MYNYNHLIIRDYIYIILEEILILKSWLNVQCYTFINLNVLTEFQVRSSVSPPYPGTILRNKRSVCDLRNLLHPQSRPHLSRGHLARIRKLGHESGNLRVHDEGFQKSLWQGVDLLLSQVEKRQTTKGQVAQRSR